MVNITDSKLYLTILYRYLALDFALLCMTASAREIVTDKKKLNC